MILESIIFKLLHKNANKRMQSITDLRTELSLLLEQVPAKA